MSQRLPTPGGDDGTWGDVLNNFLDVSHNPDGTLSSATVGTSQIQNNAVTNAQLDSPTQSAVSKANSSVQSVNTRTPNGAGAVTLQASDVSAIPSSQLGVSGGVAQLDSNSTLQAAQIPSSVASVASAYGNGYVDSINSMTIRAECYVDPVNGNDSNSGLTWLSAKRTIASALSALPANGGRIELGYGTHNVSSTGRWDTCTFTSGSQTVTDSSITNADVGTWIISPYVDDHAQITAVTSGVSFTLSIAAATSGAVSSIITKPAILVPAGVELIGRGSSFTGTNGAQFGPMSATTAIADAGTGVTIMPLKNVDSQIGAQTYSGSGLRHLSVNGNSNNIFGFWGANIWYQIAEDVDFQSHGMAGAALGDNMNSTPFRDCRFMANGTSGATRVTGGLMLTTPTGQVSAAVLLENCFFTDNYGWGLVATNTDATPWTTATPVDAATLIDCQFNEIKQTTVTGSGTGAYLGGDNGQVQLMGCWFESCDLQPVKIAPDNGATIAIGCTFAATGGSNGNNVICLAVNNGPGGLTGSFVAIGCSFKYATFAYIQVDSNVKFSWMGCSVSSTSIPYAVNGSNATIATAAQAAGIGQVGYAGGVAYQSIAATLASGKVSLSAGSTTVANTSITANSIIRLNRQASGGTLGELSVTLTANTSFTINSSSGSDTSSVYYEVVSY